MNTSTFSTEVGKAQWVRVLDVILIGPLMVAGGMSLTKKSPFWGVLLGAMGIGTVLYNGRNWLILEQIHRSEQPPTPALAGNDDWNAEWKDSTARITKAQALAKLLRRAGTSPAGAQDRLRDRFQLTDSELRAVLRSVWGPKGDSR